MLEVKDLRIEFYDHSRPEVAVRDVDFTLKEGEILGLVGESGSGKSLTANAIAGAEDVYLSMGFDDYLSGGGITVIEWADKFEELSQLPERTFKVDIERVNGPEQDKRRITVVFPGDPGLSDANGNETEGE